MDDKKQQIMLINMGGRGNIGDRAMALNVIRQLRNAAPDAALLVGPHTLDFMIEEFDLTRYPYLSHCFSRWGSIASRLGKTGLLRPFEFLFYLLDGLFILTLVLLNRYLRIDFGWRFMEAELARSISNSQVIFFCGGGYITDVGRFESRTNLIMAWFGVLARKPVIMSGQGLGPFDSWFSTFLLKRVIPRLEMITFRDATGSEQLLRKLGINWKSGCSVGDDAMSLPERSVVITDDDWQGVRFGVNFRISPFTPNLDERVEEFTHFLSIISNELNWQVNFFIFETWRPWEEGLIETIIQKGELKNFVIHKTEDPREALFLTKRCDLAIGISYHFIVFALKLGIPVLALFTGEYYRGKMGGLMEWYQKDDWVVPVHQIQAKELAEKCQQVLEEKDQIAPVLRDITGQLADASRVTIDRAVSFIGP
tara:strand:- start:22200 stop:23471 length:1272 start_codon:yes stop_codon:yes gene_type:complete